MEGMNIQPVGGRRLVLGFDARCMTCSGLASSIEEAVGDRLEVRSLSEPPMEHWRREVFGENAPWAPTLVEVSGSNVQRWTGWRMAAHMARILGTTTTWRVMQVLGQLDAVPVPETGITAKLAGRLSRAGFLKGVGGVLIAASILTGTEALAKGTPLQGVDTPAREGAVSISGALARGISTRSVAFGCGKLRRPEYLEGSESAPDGRRRAPQVYGTGDIREVGGGCRQIRYGTP